MPESPPHTHARPITPTGQGTERSQEAAGRGVMRRRRQSGQEDDENGQEGNENERRGRGRRMARRLPFGRNDESKQPDGKAPPPALYDTH